MPTSFLPRLQTERTGQEVPHVSPCGYVPQVGLRRSPWLLALSFTHILQTDFMKEPGKTIAIVEIDIISALVIPLSSDFPKMWVKVRLERRGLPAPVLCVHPASENTLRWLRHVQSQSQVSRE